MKKIAIIFDFDETLVEESTTAYLKKYGVDTDKFWNIDVKSLLEKDWDPIPAYMFKMLDFSFKNPKTAITKQSLSSFAKELKYKKGVKELFKNIRKEFNDDNVNIEFYVISSGIGEIIRNSEISAELTDIWASDFAYDENNEIIFPEKIVSFTDKTRYIFQISKGMVGKKFRGKPYIVNTKYNDNQFAIPFKNMIYIGDGLTDIPCFSLIKGNGGNVFAVYDAQNSQSYGKAWNFIKDERVSGLYSANYSIGSDLYNSIIMAIKNIVSNN